MNKRHLALAATLLVFAFGFSQALAQQNSPAENSKTTVEKQKEKAVDLLKSLAGQISTLRSAENRARIGSNIAESLWEHDEKLARALFVAVEDDIKAGFEIAQGDLIDGEKIRMVFFHLRMTTAIRIAKHDAALAVSFLKSTELPSDFTTSFEFRKLERDLEMQLANETADTSPEIALRIGRRQLEQGFSFELMHLLSRMRKKNREPAVLFLREVVSKLREVDFGYNDDALNLALGLAHYFPLRADEPAYRELANLFIAASTANACDKPINHENERGTFVCSQIASVMPLIEKTDPGRAASLRQWRSDDEEQVPEGWPELRETNDEGTVDDVLALRSKYPKLERQIYMLAMAKALEEEDSDRAHKIVDGYQGDPETRTDLVNMLKAEEESASRFEAELAGIQNTIGTIRHLPYRAEFLMSMANRIGAKDRKTALKLLDQAHEVVSSMKSGKEQADLQVVLASRYCAERSDRGLAMMGELLPKLNQLIAAAVQLDGFDSHYLREGEWNMSDEGAIGQVLLRMTQNAGHFAWCDFDRALDLADQFERPEMRMMAQLKLAQGILAGPPKRVIRRERF